MVDACDQGRCLVQSQFRLAEKLAPDVGCTHCIRIEYSHMQSRMPQCPERHAHACQVGDDLRAGPSRSDDEDGDRMVGIQQVVFGKMYFFSWQDIF